MSDNNVAVDPKKLLVILDYDEICYRLTGSQFGYFKTSFALTAVDLVPDFKSQIHPNERSEFNGRRQQILSESSDRTEARHKIKLAEAFHTAISGWEDHKDCTHYFVRHIENPHEKAQMMEDLDRVAHSMLPTKLWEPIEGLAKDIEDLRAMGAEVIIWTHGRREMVQRTLLQNGLYGIFSDDQIFDKQSLLKDGSPIGRKDKGPQNHHRVISQHGALPENTVLMDDTKANHKSAAQAGVGLRVWVDLHKADENKIIDFPKVKADSTSEGMKHIKSFLAQRNMELGNIPEAANDMTKVQPAIKLGMI